MMIVRPDITYITSVRQPIGGFDPSQDVMATTNAFTMGPMQFMAGGQAGLGRAPIQFLGPRPVQLLGLSFTDRFRALWARIKAKWAAWGIKKKLGLGFTPYGPKAWAGGRAVPMADQRAAMLVAMGFNKLPAQFAAVDSSLIARRFYNG